ncbi:MAG: hypothetical protein ACI4B6_07065 [Atopobiaceae bacterium]
MNEKERLRLKQDGFFAVRDSDKLSVRFSSGGGAFSAQQMIVLGQLAQQFGNGRVVISSRLSAEVVGIDPTDVEQIKDIADRAGLRRGLSGPRIRTVTSCMGTYCVKGTYDTLELARQINQRYTLGWVDRKLPNRFKISVGGCPNSCMKPSLNDFGIEGHIVPDYDATRCHSCRVCQVQRHCPSKAVAFVDGKVHVDPDACRTCGICRNKCPFHVFNADAPTRFQIYLGGTWGRNSRMADRYPVLIKRQDIFALLDKTLEWYCSNAKGNERFGMVLERLGFHGFLEDIGPLG